MLLFLHTNLPYLFKSNTNFVNVLFVPNSNIIVSCVFGFENVHVIIAYEKVFKIIESIQIPVFEWSLVNDLGVKHTDPSDIGTIELCVKKHLKELFFIVISDKFYARFFCLTKRWIYFLTKIKRFLIDYQSFSLKQMVVLTCG